MGKYPVVGGTNVPKFVFYLPGFLYTLLTLGQRNLFYAYFQIGQNQIVITLWIVSYKTIIS
jgi:hypothetical protein